MKVLLVDDDPNLRGVLSDTLEVKGFESVTAETGAAALARIGSQDIDVALIDLKLGDMPGLKVLRGIKECSSNTECILLTGHASQDSAIQAINLGAYSYFQKPYDVEQLLVAIQRAGEKRAAEKNLRTARRFLQNVQDSLSTHIAILDKNGVIVQVNSAWRKFGEMNGLQCPNDCLGVNYLQICDSASGEYADEAGLASLAIRNVLAGAEKEVRIEYPCHSPDEKRWFVLHVTKFDDEDQAWVVLAHENISERVQADEALQLSEEKYRALVDEVKDGFYATDSAGVFTFANPALARMYGFENPQALAGRKFTDLIVAELHTEVGESYSNAMQTGRIPEVINGQIARPDGTYAFIEIKPTFIVEKGQIVGSRGVVRDITERKKAEQELHESELRYRSIFDGVQEAIFLETPDGEIINVNESACRMYGYSREEFLKRKINDLVPSKQIILMLDESGIGNLPRHPIETINLRANGKPFPVEISGQIQFIDGQPSMLVVVRDITERKLAEEALRQAEAKYRSIFENAIEGIFQITLEGNFFTVNPALAHMLGYDSSEELIVDMNNLNHKFYVQPAHREEFMRRLSDYGTVFNFESEVYRKDGSTIWISENAQAMRDDLGQVHYYEGTLENITKRKQSEDEIRQHVAELEMLYQSGLTLNQLLSPKEIGEKIIELLEQKMDWHHTTIRIYNPQDETLELLAFNQPGLVGEKEYFAVEKRFSALISKSGDGLSGWVVQNSQIVRSGDVSNDPRYIESYPGLHSGLYVPLKSSEHMIGVISIESEQPNAFNEEDERLVVTLANQAAVAFENAHLYQTARQEIIERKRIEALLADERNQLARRVEERTADINRVNSELARAMRVKDEFLASMSHELRTPLTGILGLSEALQVKTYGELNDKQQKILKMIEESGRHLLDLINDILDLSKIEAGKFELQFEPCSLADICQASLQLIKGMAQHKHQQVHYSPPAEPIIVRADARRIKQLLVNLLSNAIKFTPESGELGLEVQANESERNFKLIVWDKGIGIKTEDQHKLFKPFVQLDSGLTREYSGTGLGLNLARRLTELHNGTIEVESVFGEGSRLTITLPWSPQDTTPIPSPQRGTGELVMPSKNSKPPLVMFADDNETVLQMVVDFLETKHYRVMKIRSGTELLEKAAEFHPNIMLVDIQMPGMDGLETIRRIRSHADPLIATAPVIAVTALAMPSDREDCLRAGANEYMSKPVKLKALAAAIQKLITDKR